MSGKLTKEQIAEMARQIDHASMAEMESENRRLRSKVASLTSQLGETRGRIFKWQARLAGIGPMIDNQYAWKVQQELKWEMLSFADKELALAAIKAPKEAA